MGDGGNGFLTKATVVETVLRAVYGRGEATVERSYQLPLEAPEEMELAVLGSHATNQAIADLAVVAVAGGGKRVKVTGTFDLLLWLKVGSGSQVASGTLTFSEEIPLDGPAGVAYGNETASARFQGPPEAGPVRIVRREGRRVAEVPVRLSLAAEVTGDARILVYAHPSSP